MQIKKHPVAQPRGHVKTVRFPGDSFTAGAGNWSLASNKTPTCVDSLPVLT